MKQIGEIQLNSSNFGLSNGWLVSLFVGWIDVWLKSCLIGELLNCLVNCLVVWLVVQFLDKLFGQFGKLVVLVEVKVYVELSRGLFVIKCLFGWMVVCYSVC